MPMHYKNCRIIAVPDGEKLLNFIVLESRHMLLIITETSKFYFYDYRLDVMIYHIELGNSPTQVSWSYLEKSQAVLAEIKGSQDMIILVDLSLGRPRVITDDLWKDIVYVVGTCDSDDVYTALERNPSKSTFNLSEARVLEDALKVSPTCKNVLTAVDLCNKSTLV